jgi:hypothetical protein
VRWLLTFAVLVLMTGRVASAPLDWNDEKTVRWAAFCVAVFEYRAELASKWSSGRPSLLDLGSADRIMQIADRHGRAACYSGGGTSTYRDLFQRGPFYLGCGWTISEVKYSYRAKIQDVYEGSGLTGAFPPTCMEDQACLACRDLLRALTD